MEEKECKGYSTWELHRTCVGGCSRDHLCSDPWLLARFSILSQTQSFHCHLHCVYVVVAPSFQDGHENVLGQVQKRAGVRSGAHLVGEAEGYFSLEKLK